MRLVIQRVSKASLTVDGADKGAIGKGLVVYVGFADSDAERNDWEKVFTKVINKLIGLRVFPDSEGKMNLSIQDIRGGIVLVSNFTLYADISRGKRPSFTKALKPDIAESLYKKLEQMFMQAMEAEGLSFLHGTFGADMDIDAVSWGPVNIVWDI
ncbi:D-tyrosyl-tRNA(Tyr) deacylase [bacterium 3DAC]|jgi:D-tyrosyl-tRNA(Tyr) deacylase|nr:D-tyrosyl-tRNA(Tyr) deacylase [Dictyoglomota bacterium]UZN22947.1 D-tyrosyl-tRNA(Tyr) deacylase [bacterium 3DAC]